MKRIQGRSARYGLALVMVSLAVWLRWSLPPNPGPLTPYMTVFPVIVLIAILLGIGPGLLAGGCGIVAVEFWIRAHARNFQFGLMEGSRAILVIACAAYLGQIGRRLRRAEFRAWEEARIARRARRRAAESELRYRSLFDNNPCGVFAVDVEGRFTAVNPAGEHLTGYSRAELLTMGFQHLCAPEQLDQAVGWFREGLAGVPQTREIAIVHKAGHRVELCMTGMRIMIDGRVEGIFFRTENITERKRAEAALREADQRKDEFLAMLAHELRNPLAPVRNAIHILRAVGAREPVAQRQHEIIDRQVTHMAHLLDDLLDVARITRGKIVLKRQAMALEDVLLHVVETVTPLLRARGHTLHFNPAPDDLFVVGDFDRLAQVLGNLLINAAKFTDEGGQIWFQVRRENEQAIIRVRDTGEGIAPGLLPHVFELFTQADHSLVRSQGGLGIGLTMVHKLVALHGGTVEASSEGPGRGSEFIVRLPLLPGSVHEAESPSQASPAAGDGTMPACRILVVDDLVDTARSLAELLEIWGHNARTAHSGGSALEVARIFQPEMVLLDIGMPGMDGHEVARRLRQMPETAGVRLVALTGYGQESDREQTRASGFDAHLVKPVDLDALRELLAQSVSIPKA